MDHDLGACCARLGCGACKAGFYAAGRKAVCTECPTAVGGSIGLVFLFYMLVCLFVGGVFNIFINQSENTGVVRRSVFRAIHLILQSELRIAALSDIFTCVKYVLRCFAYLQCLHHAVGEDHDSSNSGAFRGQLLESRMVTLERPGLGVVCRYKRSTV